MKGFKGSMYFHVWFVTKYRKPILTGKTEKAVKGALAECILRHRFGVLELEANIDHMHMLLEAKNKEDLAAIVRTLKAVSAKQILASDNSQNIKHFWARRYGYRELDECELENIKEYIRNQKKDYHTLPRVEC